MVEESMAEGYTNTRMNGVNSNNNNNKVPTFAQVNPKEYNSNNNIDNLNRNNNHQKQQKQQQFITIK